MRSITWGDNQYIGTSEDELLPGNTGQTHHGGPTHSRLSSLSNAGNSPRQALSHRGDRQTNSSSNFTQ